VIAFSFNLGAERNFMMWHRFGLRPISTIGLGLLSVSSDIPVPRPPASITAFICFAF